MEKENTYNDFITNSAQPLEMADEKVLIMKETMIEIRREIAIMEADAIRTSSKLILTD